MNRQIELSELISKSFIESTNKMSQDDKLAFYQAILDGDKNLEREILKKYNYTMVTPVENIMSDEDAEALANSLLKDEKGVFNEINNLFVSASKKYWSNAERLSDLPLEQHDKILNHARELQTSFNSKEHVNSVLHGIYGENASTIVKAAIIADLIGCLDLRNDLMVVFGSMVENAHNSKAMDIFKKKKVISEDRSLAKKGKTNRHHATAIKIAADTWGKYPNASLAGLSEDISAHLRKAWKDVPVAGTIEKWLKDSGLNPAVKPKNRNYELIILEGE
ncbi:TPA: hypothetical protein ACPZ1K_001773 [Enterobacter hormaechei subsp. xiangfangensis]|uniref:hypothetical protein n=1 Tax=Enterobacteriaceae TaxID=543 RepID=UPI00167FC56A|nr:MULTISPECIES: hypothetical protein [Enterobacter]EIV9521624.1 hypothetical protein [Klebsiella pneumoniae]EKX1084843.1 hypothetical protein [Klebsiella pneumoniae]EKX3987505.1 hypothetical protein [Klebsiella pneumoniae]EKX3992598.1 hypothetical protein [Klebsiella pneumoniae]EKX4108450.1 hypothetical protein [Klebsiella pneumoniae]